jgi:hypothetical protein
MLYFSHMNPPRSAASEAIKSQSLPDVPKEISVLLDELSPFGLFLSQFLYMTNWLFPGNRLPDSIQAAAKELESADYSQKIIPLDEKRENDLS